MNSGFHRTEQAKQEHRVVYDTKPSVTEKSMNEEFTAFWLKETGREPDLTQDRDHDAWITWQAAYLAGQESKAERIKELEKHCASEGHYKKGWYEQQEKIDKLEQELAATRQSAFEEAAKIAESYMSSTPYAVSMIHMTRIDIANAIRERGKG